MEHRSPFDAPLSCHARHGDEIGKLIEERSGGAVTFSAAALYPRHVRLFECEGRFGSSELPSQLGGMIESADQAALDEGCV